MVEQQKHPLEATVGDFGPDLVRRFLDVLRIDMNREGLADTPERVFKAWQFWTSGYSQSIDDVFKSFEDGGHNYDEIVFQGAIPFYSSCEHHLTPFFGIAHVGYIPGGRIIGLSKVGRLIDILSRRLQVQERLTTQISAALQTRLNPIGVGVVLQARHLCMEARGVMKSGTVTTTSSLIGALKDKPEARAEFMTMVQMAAQRGMDVL